MRIALIKTSSMGDVIHALPVVTDIVAAHPGAQIDWVVEEGFADLPALHPAVGEVIPVAIRRWRRSLGSLRTWSQIRAARARLRSARYDLAIDLQGLVKSACVARWTGAPIAGFDRASVREPLAALAYSKRFAVSRELHAIERLRSLASQALGYRFAGGPRFALVAPAMPLHWRPPTRYAVLLHATSRAEKLWPDDRWVELGARLRGAGTALVLLWGSETERAAAERLARAIAEAGAGSGVSDFARASAIPGASGIPDASDASEANAVPAGATLSSASDVLRVLQASGASRVSAIPDEATAIVVAPRIALGACARLLADAAAVVGVDTGLTHLAAALGVPTVALFAATPAWRFGPYWSPRAMSLGADGVWPSAGEVAAALDGLTEARPGRPAR